MKLQKIIKIFSLILMEMILLLSAGMLGMQNERKRIIQEEQAETVTDIAIVNLDKGVYENNTTKYYSSELMNLDLDNLVAENLEAARQGINNGSYAAYILIPAEFSENAVSLNSVPTKSALEFAVNPNLREDVSRLTMANIKNFEINLNTNMSYMYVQAILEEFHGVQDSAGIIMKNDSDEMARLMGIAPEGLMASPEPFEVEWADPDIEDVDFDEAFETNSQISEDLRDNYDEFVTQGEEAFEVIKEGEAAVVEGMDTFLDIMMEIDIETDDEGNVVYEQGLNDLSAYVEEYEEEFTQQKNKVFEMIDASVFITPTPTPTQGTETPMPASSPTPTSIGGQVPEPVSTPTSTPTMVPDEVPTATITPEIPGGDQEPSPTPSATPEVVSIPEIIKKTLDNSLDKANQQIAEKNANMENQINEIRKKIADMQKLLGGQTSTITYGVLIQGASTSGQTSDDMPENQDSSSKQEEDAENNPAAEDGTDSGNASEKEDGTGSGNASKKEDGTGSGNDSEKGEDTDSKNDLTGEENSDAAENPVDEEEPDDGNDLMEENKPNSKNNVSDEKEQDVGNASVDEQESYGEIVAKTTIRKPMPIFMSPVAGTDTVNAATTLNDIQVKQLLDALDEIEEALNQITLLDEMTIEEIYDEEIIKEEFRNLAKEIQALPELSIDEYTGIFEEGIIGPLQEEIINENTKVQDEGSKYMEIQSEYLEELGLFDPYEYYDYEKMDKLTAAFMENIFELEEKVYESQDGYLELVYDTVDTSNESMDAMQENLEKAYVGTEGNVHKEVELAKEYRQQMNETNIEILGGFKEKLPYTRVGKLEYVQAYDFMVKPIKMWDNSVNRNRVSFWQDTDILRNILISLIVIWGISVCALLVIRVYYDARENFDGE